MEYSVTVRDLYDLSYTRAVFLGGLRYPWEALGCIVPFLETIMPRLGEDFLCLANGVYVHRTACVSPSAGLCPPCVIGAGTTVRQGALLRGGVLAGEGCVIGNSSELKNCILFDGVQVPHFNYVGDSILGRKAHMGAGSVISNLKSDGSSVTVCRRGERIPTGRRKCGAFLGDFAEVGCNAVLCPGTVVGKRSVVYPLLMLRGVYPADCVIKPSGIVPRRRTP